MFKLLKRLKTFFIKPEKTKSEKILDTITKLSLINSDERINRERIELDCLYEAIVDGIKQGHFNITIDNLNDIYKNHECVIPDRPKVPEPVVEKKNFLNVLETSLQCEKESSLHIHKIRSDSRIHFGTKKFLFQYNPFNKKFQFCILSTHDVKYIENTSLKELFQTLNKSPYMDFKWNGEKGYPSYKHEMKDILEALCLKQDEHNEKSKELIRSYK